MVHPSHPLNEPNDPTVLGGDIKRSIALEMIGCERQWIVDGYLKYSTSH